MGYHVQVQLRVLWVSLFILVLLLIPAAFAGAVSDITDDMKMPGTFSGLREIWQSLYQTGWS